MNLFEQKTYRVFLDESYYAEKDPIERKNKAQYAELRGRHGMIYPYSSTQLAIYFNALRVGSGFKKQSGWTLQQEGDFELVYFFPNSDLPIAANAIKAKRRKQLSPEVLAALRERAKKLGSRALPGPRLNDSLPG